MAETTTLARPYAKAAFELAREGNSLSQWSEDLAKLATVVSDALMKKVLSHPGLTSEQKAEVVLESVSGGLRPQASNFVKALSMYHRLPLLPEVASLFEQHRASLESTVDVTVESAFEIEEAAQSRLAGALQKKLNRKVTLQTTLNRDLIGGVVIRAGDTVIDASVRGRLQKLVEAVQA